MDSGIYAIIAPELRIIYIGQSQHMRKRWAQHRHNFSQPHGVRRANNLLRRAWQKHGPDKFDFVVIEHCDVDRLTEREEYWLGRARARSLYRVANTTGPSDNPMRGQKHSPDTIQKLRAASSAFVRTDAHKRAIGDAMRGRKLGKDHIEKMRRSKTGKKIQLLTGDRNPSRSEVHRARMTGDSNPAKRADVRLKISISISKPVIDTKSGQTWCSQSECAESLGVMVQAVNRNIKGHSKTCAGRILSAMDVERLAELART